MSNSLNNGIVVTGPIALTGTGHNVTTQGGSIGSIAGNGLHGQGLNGLTLDRCNFNFRADAASANEAAITELGTAVPSPISCNPGPPERSRQ